MIQMLNMDCMDFMAKQPDKAFELAIVDPPYGDGGGAAMERKQTQSLRRMVRKVPYRKVNHGFGGWFAKLQERAALGQGNIKSGVALTRMTLGIGTLLRQMNTLRNFSG